MDHLYFRENDSKGADAIVFIHGGGISGRMWQADLQALSEYHCLAPDLPGHGQSADIRPFALENSVAGLADLIRMNVPAGRAAVVGISVGAIVGIALCNHHPELVEKAFWSGTSPRMGRLVTRLANVVSSAFLSLVPLKHRVNFVAKSVGLSDEQKAEFREDLEKITPELSFQINEMLAQQPDPHPGSPPTVVLVGENEFRANTKRACEVASALGKEEVYIVPGLGHGWCFENPGLFRRAVRRWMSNADLKEDFVALPI